MATKYLDSTGLTYLWGKLKAYFQPKLVSGTNIKTINNQSLLGSGNITIQGGSGSGTSTPTANTVAMFDSSKHMNSEDMSASDVSSFIGSLDTSGGGDDNGAWDHINSNYVIASKRYGMVTVYGESNGTVTLSAGSWNNIGTLGAGYIPTANFDFVAFDRNHLQPLWGQVTNQGVVRIYCDSNQACNYWIYSTAFPVAR